MKTIITSIAALAAFGAGAISMAAPSAGTEIVAKDEKTISLKVTGMT